jgi:hypothetical protein
VAASIGAYVELHVEQGRALDDLGSGRRRGHRDPGARPLAVRRDRPRRPRRHHPAGGPRRPDARARADGAGGPGGGGRCGGVATVGRVLVEPNGVNAIPARVRTWLDARADEEATVRAIVADVAAAAGTAPVEESWTPRTDLDAGAARPAGGAAGRGPGARDRRRARRRHPRAGGDPDGDAVRPQPDRHLARTGGARGRATTASPAWWRSPTCSRTCSWPTRRRRRPTQGARRDRSDELPRRARLAADRPRRRRRDRRADGRFTRVEPGGAPAPGAERLRGLVLPGAANAHSHAFHRALRGRTHAAAARSGPGGRRCTGRGHARPRRLPRPGAGGVRGDGARRLHRGGRVPLPAPRPRRPPVRGPERDGRGADRGRRGRRTADRPARHLLPRRGHRPARRRGPAPLQRRRGGPLGRPRRRPCTPPTPAGTTSSSARPSTRSGRCPRTRSPWSPPGPRSARPAARPRLRAAGRERGLPGRLRPHADAAARRPRGGRAAHDGGARHPPDGRRPRRAR